MNQTNFYDIIIIGAGAAGLMAAVSAGSCGKCVLIIEHTNKIGEKIRISGGGRCNFTNLHTTSRNFICQNPHFVKSALAKYTQFDFIDLLKLHKIEFHEKTLGQLFCDGSSKQVIQMLLDESKQNKVEIKFPCKIDNITKSDRFNIHTDHGNFVSDSLIIATGGLSIPKIGATAFGYEVAQQFGLKIVPTKPALVPLIVEEKTREAFAKLAGISNHSIVKNEKISFTENILFTHKGLSGPAILQISSYLDDFRKEEININLLPNIKLVELFKANRNTKQTLSNFLKQYLTNRFVDNLSESEINFDRSMTEIKNEELAVLANLIHNFRVQIAGTEGYQKAEVTSGGVDTNELSSQTMESKKVKGLYFIGEVVDVTGWLGGYNFQWAWSSGYAAGTAVARIA